MKSKHVVIVLLVAGLVSVSQARQRRRVPQQRVNLEQIQMQNAAPNQLGWNRRGAQQMAGPAIHAPYEGPMTATKVQTAVDDALQFLRSQQNPDGSIGQNRYAQGGGTALAALAMLAAGGNPLSDLQLKKALDYLKALEIDNTYVVAIRANVWEYALRKVPHEDSYRQALKRDFEWLLEARNEVGWRYNLNSPDWDNSCTQYGVLGLWAAARAGFTVPDEVWQAMSKHFRDVQNQDGGWGYQRGGSSPNMATAGLASLFLVFDMYHGKTAYRRSASGDGGPRTFQEGDAKKVLDALNEGMEWLGKAEGDKENSYYLYGIERAGVASGRKTFGGEDWFARGAEVALTRQRADGAIDMGYGPVPSTSLVTLFLVYGGAPVAFAKLEHGEGTDWNLNPRDVANVTKQLWTAYERPLNWHVVNLDQPAGEYEAPLLFISGTQALKLSDAQVERLREYVLGGGTIVAEPSDHAPAFRKSVEKLVARMFPPKQWPGRTLKPLAEDHGVFTVLKQSWRNERPKLSGVSDGARTFFFLSEGYLSGEWQVNDVEADGFLLATNLLLYATDLGTLQGRFASPIPDDEAAPKAGTLKVARVRYGSEAGPRAWDVAARSWKAVAPYVAHVAGVAVEEAKPVDLARGVPKVDLLHLSGRGVPQLSIAAEANLKLWLDGGGVLLIDAWGGDAEFAAAARDLARRLVGELEALDPGDPLAVGRFEGGADLAKVRLELSARRLLRKLGRRLTGQHLEVARLDGRPAVVFSRFDLASALAGVELYRAPGYEPASARRIVANLAGWLASR